ncbi:synaptotagmin XVII, isoform CRA_a [Mus musculus]|nr:synaptotagmin XVII, isoform CRA_a [Mus musculus]
MLEPLNEGLLSRISDVLLCGWTCQHCCQRCYESSCCQSSEDEVEILGPFPAQTPPWLSGFPAPQLPTHRHQTR